MEIIKDRSFTLAERYVNETGMSVFLTGKAGTGKTTFLRSIVNGSTKRCAVVAPTGVAAINAGGVTIHSFFQLPLCPYLPDVKELITEYQLPEKQNQLRKERIKVLRSLDLLIIDEISMVRADILDAIDYMLRRYRRNDRPFGGVQLLMIGDLQQLPPVIKEDERKYYEQVYPSPFFFYSKALQKTPYITLQLETVYRQQSQDFVDILNDVRRGHPTDATLEILNSRFVPSFNAPEGENWIRLTTHNAIAERVNAEKLASIDGESRCFEAMIEGNFPESMYPGETQLELKVGAQVMFIRNNSLEGYYNGKIGVVSALEPEIIVTDEEGNDFTVNEEVWENIKYSVNASSGEIEMSREGAFHQIPLRHAWAVTIHKSQGLTFDRVIIDAGAAFSFGQIYVALSRCRSLDGIVLASRITRRGFFSDSDVAGFEQAFISFESAENDFAMYKREQYIQTLCEAFDLDPLRHLYNRINRIYHVELPNKFYSYAKQFAALSDPSLDMAGDSQYIGLKQLKDVATRFKAQLTRLGASIPREEECPSIEMKQRTAKGAAYFSDQLGFLAEKIRPFLDIEIGNKDARKAFKSASKAFLIELRFRMALYTEILLHGFSEDEFRKRRAQAETKSENS